MVYSLSSADLSGETLTNKLLSSADPLLCRLLDHAGVWVWQDVPELRLIDKGPYLFPGITQLFEVVLVAPAFPHIAVLLTGLHALQPLDCLQDRLSLQAKPASHKSQNMLGE